MSKKGHPCQKRTVLVDRDDLAALVGRATSAAVALTDQRNPDVAWARGELSGKDFTSLIHRLP